MIFKSSSFTTMAEYKKARTKLCQSIKNHFKIDGPLRLPHNAIILVDNDTNLDITDTESAVAPYINGVSKRYLKTLNLKIK